MGSLKCYPFLFNESSKCKTLTEVVTEVARPCAETCGALGISGPRGPASEDAFSPPSSQRSADTQAGAQPRPCDVGSKEGASGGGARGARGAWMDSGVAIPGGSPTFILGGFDATVHPVSILLCIYFFFFIS